MPARHGLTAARAAPVGRQDPPGRCQQARRPVHKPEPARARKPATCPPLVSPSIARPAGRPWVTLPLESGRFDPALARAGESLTTLGTGEKGKAVKLEDGRGDRGCAPAFGWWVKEPRIFVAPSGFQGGAGFPVRGLPLSLPFGFSTDWGL